MREWDTVCARMSMLGVNECEPQMRCEAPTSLSLQASITQAHLGPPRALRHTRIALSGSGLCQRQTSWVTPLQKGPLLTDAYQLACWAPSTVSPPVFLSPIRALVGSTASRLPGEGWG